MQNNIVFNKTLKQYNKRYRHHKNLLKFNKKEVEEFDKVAKTIGENYLLRKNNWWYIDGIYYQAPKILKHYWFRNLNIGVQAISCLLGTGLISTAVAVPLIISLNAGPEIIVENIDKVILSNKHFDKDGNTCFNVKGKDDKKIYSIEITIDTYKCVEGSDYTYDTTTGDTVITKICIDNHPGKINIKPSFEEPRKETAKEKFVRLANEYVNTFLNGYKVYGDEQISNVYIDNEEIRSFSFGYTTDDEGDRVFYITGLGYPSLSGYFFWFGYSRYLGDNLKDNLFDQEEGVTSYEFTDEYIKYETTKKENDKPYVVKINKYGYAEEYFYKEDDEEYECKVTFEGAPKVKQAYVVPNFASQIDSNIKIESVTTQINQESPKITIKYTNEGDDKTYNLMIANSNGDGFDDLGEVTFRSDNASEINVELKQWIDLNDVDSVSIEVGKPNGFFYGKSDVAYFGVSWSRIRNYLFIEGTPWQLDDECTYNTNGDNRISVEDYSGRITVNTEEECIVRVTCYYEELSCDVYVYVNQEEPVQKIMPHDQCGNTTYIVPNTQSFIMINDQNENNVSSDCTVSGYDTNLVNIQPYTYEGAGLFLISANDVDPGQKTSAIFKYSDGITCKIDIVIGEEPTQDFFAIADEVEFGKPKGYVNVYHSRDGSIWNNSNYCRFLIDDEYDHSISIEHYSGRITVLTKKPLNIPVHIYDEFSREEIDIIVKINGGEQQ